jgi:hypothetical protein
MSGVSPGWALRRDRQSRPLVDGRSAMRFEVPAGTLLVFSGSDGALLPTPVACPQVRTVETPPED